MKTVEAGEGKKRKGGAGKEASEGGREEEQKSRRESAREREIVEVLCMTKPD